MRSRTSCARLKKCPRISTHSSPFICRPYGQIGADVADGQYEFCGAAASKHDEKGIEQNAKTKADITAALKTAFADCDAIYAGMTDEKQPS